MKTMQLTEKTLKCMEIGSDKAHKTGCIIYSPSLGYKIVLGTNRNRHKNVFPENRRLLYMSLGHPGYHESMASVYYNDHIGESSDGFCTIGMPIDSGRLMYLYHTAKKQKKINYPYDIEEIFEEYPDYYNQTIIDWQSNEKLMDKLLHFLSSLY